MINRNTLNRSMFANGDEVFVPTGENPYPTGYSSQDNISSASPINNRGDEDISQEIIDYAKALGIDTTGKPAKQILLEINTAIDVKNEKNKPGLIGGKGSTLFDYTDPIDIAATGLAATGIGAPLAAYVKTANIGRKLKKAYDTSTKSQKYLAGAGGLGAADLFIDNDSRNFQEVPEDITSALESLDKKKNPAVSVAKSPAEIKKAKKDKEKKDIESIENSIKFFEELKNKELEAYQDDKKARKGRNANIFLEEMSLAMAGTNNLADGIAVGAANAASKVGDADEAEELAKAKFLEDKAKANKKGELKATEVIKIAENYNKFTGDLEGNGILLGEIGKLRSLLQQNDVTGLQGWMNRLVTSAQGFTGTDLELNDASKASNIAKFLEARMVQALLDEKGKTISDADRALIKDLLGNIEKTTSNKQSIIDLLMLTERTLTKSNNDARTMIDFYDAEYGSQMPNLDLLRRKSNNQTFEETEQGEDDAEIQISSDMIT